MLETSALAAFLALAASSSSTTPTRPADATKDPGHATKSDATSAAPVETSVGAPDSQPDVVIDPLNCVAPGASSSELGIGGYCSPGGEQCLHAGSGGTPTDCSADFGAPSHEWFCTITCTLSTDCGPGGGTCVTTPFAQVCVPTACNKNLGDASTGYTDGGDAGSTTDAGDSGAAHDGSTSDAAPHEAAHDGSVDAPSDASHD